MPFTTNKWDELAQNLLSSYQGSSVDWRSADAETIRKAVRGVSPYSGKLKKGGSAKVVFNISSAHIPSFVAWGYKNRYELNVRLGDPPKSNGPDARKQIDCMLANLFGASYNCEKLYYGAVELNGSGIRYYGDVCLVLKDSEVVQDTKVLNRNSFDLICEPLLKVTHPGGAWDAASAEKEADKIAGEWGELGDMVICKTLKPYANDERRITIGALSDAILADEDYLEVIRQNSFKVSDLAEARLAAADAAVDGLVADRLRRGPVPNLGELLWRHRRRKADKILRTKGIPTKVVVSSGRIRS